MIASEPPEGRRSFARTRSALVIDVAMTEGERAPAPGAIARRADGARARAAHLQDGRGILLDP